MQRGSAAGKLGDETNKAKLFEVFMQSSKSYLEARGLRPETAQAHRLEIDTAPTAERIIQRLGDDIQIAPGQPLSVYAKELLWFPFQNSDGAITSWSVRIFPTPANGPKFLVAKGSNNAPYIPLGTWAVMGRVDVPVVVTEGPKALAIVQNGFPAIGLNGVYGACARDADDKIILHPLLASFAWLKRSVYLCRRSIQNVPLVIESKCTTLGVLFSNWVSVFIARVKWGYGRQQPPVFQPKAVTCSP